MGRQTSDQTQVTESQGVPERATAVVVNTLRDNGVDEAVINATLDAFQSGKSGNVAPGTAYSRAQSVPGLATLLMAMGLP